MSAVRASRRAERTGREEIMTKVRGTVRRVVGRLSSRWGDELFAAQFPVAVLVEILKARFDVCRAFLAGDVLVGREEAVAIGVHTREGGGAVGRGFFGGRIRCSGGGERRGGGVAIGHADARRIDGGGEGGFPRECELREAGDDFGVIFGEVDGFGAVGGEPVQSDALGVGGEEKFPIAVAHGEARAREVLAFASSTANDLSNDADAWLRARFAQGAGHLGQGGAYAACLDDLRGTIREAYGLSRDIDVFFAPPLSKR